MFQTSRFQLPKVSSYWKRHPTSRKTSHMTTSKKPFKSTTKMNGTTNFSIAKEHYWAGPVKMPIPDLGDLPLFVATKNGHVQRTYKQNPQLICWIFLPNKNAIDTVPTPQNPTNLLLSDPLGFFLLSPQGVHPSPAWPFRTAICPSPHCWDPVASPVGTLLQRTPGCFQK